MTTGRRAQRRRHAQHVLPLALAALALAGCGASKPALLVGAVDDAAKWAPNPRVPMHEARAAGFRAVVVSAVWHRGAVATDDLPPLRRAVAAAKAEDVEPLLAVYQLSSSTPATPTDRAAFASYAVALVKALPEVRNVLVGNEPNLNLFWLPQFGPDGADVAAAGYEALLAETYDALKNVDPKLTVIGGNLAPRGGDDPSAARPTHSPTRFILDLGAVYRATERTKPLFDRFSVHVYGESARIPPTLRHPRTTSLGIADHDTLVRLLKSAFGTAPPIVYGEYGVETAIPPAKRPLYSGHEVVSVVDEATQARYYRQAVSLAACQRDVRMLFFFHVADEPQLAGLQSGLYYADGSPKSSLALVRPRLEHPSAVACTP